MSKVKTENPKNVSKIETDFANFATKKLLGLCGGKVGPECECQKWCRPHLSTAQTGYKALSGIFIYIGLREGVKNNINLTVTPPPPSLTESIYIKK